MRIILAIVTILLFISCNNNRVLVKDVEKFIDQQIILPFDWNAVLKGKDVILNGFVDVPIKLVVWYDSLVCGSCEVKRMFEWNDITAYADSLNQWFRIVFLFTPKKENVYTVNYSLKAERFGYPVFIDENASFAKQNNRLPKNRQLHSFLLDKNNRVVMVGNPLRNPMLWNLYKSTIQKMIVNNGVLPDK